MRQWGMTMVMTRMTRAVTMPRRASHCASGGNVGVTFMTMFLHVVGGLLRRAFC
jgi:hypothetical protein